MMLTNFIKTTDVTRQTVAFVHNSDGEWSQHYDEICGWIIEENKYKTFLYHETLFSHHVPIQQKKIFQLYTHNSIFPSHRQRLDSKTRRCLNLNGRISTFPLTLLAWEIYGWVILVGVGDKTLTSDGLDSFKTFMGLLVNNFEMSVKLSKSFHLGLHEKWRKRQILV